MSKHQQNSYLYIKKKFSLASLLSTLQFNKIMDNLGGEISCLRVRFKVDSLGMILSLKKKKITGCKKCMSGNIFFSWEHQLIAKLSIWSLKPEMGWGEGILKPLYCITSHIQSLLNLCQVILLMPSLHSTTAA